MKATKTDRKKTHISKKVLEKINHGHVKMKSSCLFMACSCFWFGLAGFLFLLAALFVSLATYYVCALEPFELLSVHPLILLEALPYLLIIAAAGALFLAAGAYRKSRNYCRHENWVLLSVLAVGALLIGLSIHCANFEHKIRFAMEKNAIYDGMVVTAREFWFQPEKGTLSGLVTGIDDRQNLQIKSWDGSRWEVNIKENCPNQNKGDLSPVEMKIIKMIGQQNGGRRFEARNFWYW